MVKVLICDDEKAVTIQLQSLIQKNFPKEVQVTATDSPGEVFSIMKTEKPDVVIMDILLQDNNGIDICYVLQQKYPDCKIIFITGYAQYVQDIFFKVKPYGYLKKPIDEAKLVRHIQTIRDEALEEEQLFSFSYQRKRVSIRQKDICYIESQRAQLLIHTVHMDYATYGKLDDVQAELSRQFIRCHKSYLVNAAYIESIDLDTNVFVVHPGRDIHISRNKKKEAKEQYFQIQGGLV